MWVEGDHHGHSFDSNFFGPVSPIFPSYVYNKKANFI